MNKIKYLFINIIVLIFLINCQNATFAADTGYSNNLLKLNIEKDKNNAGIDVTLFTSKPSGVKLTPIKRSENEYIIFLPETYHSITAKPDISSLPEIQDVDVKLIPYMDSQTNNGYTKITIKTKKDGVKLNIKNQVFEQDKLSDLSQLAASNMDKKAENIAKLAKKTEIKKIKVLTKPENKPNSNISNYAKNHSQIVDNSLSAKIVEKQTNTSANIKPEKTKAKENSTIVLTEKNTDLSLNKNQILITNKKYDSKTGNKNEFPYFKIIIALAAFAVIRLAITFATFNRQKILIAKKREEKNQSSSSNAENTLSQIASIANNISDLTQESLKYEQSENLEKYSSIIENIVRKSPKFSGNEDLVNEFCNEIIKRSYNLILCMDNSQNPETYLNRISRPAIIQVLKDNERLKSLL